MSTGRKLQAEIDRVLKKISEGIVEFSSTWDKVQTASTASLKEKYEADLKKEIKKLQRYRDQIKSWAGGNEVKNKKPLLDARRQIETEMERFKVLEKETKTKAYSKEGLSQSAKRSANENREEPNSEIIEWIDDVIQRIKDQQAEIEEQNQALIGNKRKTKGQTDTLALCQKRLDQHSWHCDKLEEAKSRLESGQISTRQLGEVKDNVEYYVESNHEPDFMFDDGIYDALDDEPRAPSPSSPRPSSSEEDEPPPAKPVVAQPPALKAAAPVPKVAEPERKAPVPKAAPKAIPNAAEVQRERERELREVRERETRERETREREAALAREAREQEAREREQEREREVQAQLLRDRERDDAEQAERLAQRDALREKAIPKSSSSGAGPAGTTNSLSNNLSLAASRANANIAKTAAPSPKVAKIASRARGPTPVEVQQHEGGATLASIIKNKNNSFARVVPNSESNEPATTVYPGEKNDPAVTPSLPISAALAYDEASVHSFSFNAHSEGAHAMHAQMPAQSNHVSQSGKMFDTSNMSGPSAGSAGLAGLPFNVGGSSIGASMYGNNPSVSNMLSDASLAASLGDGFSDNREAKAAAAAVGEEYTRTLKLLEPSLRHLPDPSDAERAKIYNPRNPWPTPSYFPSTPAAAFDDPAIFEKFSIDTLFFIFYFQQGTAHQYLAARELKKQSWRYHKQLFQWFQRHDEPKLTTDEHEKGTYLYFDYAKNWKQCIQEEFTFEYCHLEDELLQGT